MAYILDDDVSPDCEINLQWIAGRDDGSTDPNCRNVILSFIAYLHPKDYLIPLNILIDKFSKVYSEEFEQLTSEEFLNYLKTKLRRKFEFEGNDAISLIQDIEIEYQRNDFHKDFFPYFFAFRLSRIPYVRIKDFLAYNLTRNFEYKTDEFSYFVKNVVAKEFTDLIGKDKLESAMSCIDLLIKDAKGERKEGRRYTQHQIALGIYYKHIAGTLMFWADGNKEKEIVKLADQYGGSWISLQKAYNEFSQAQSGDKRLAFIAKEKNATAVQSFLDSDAKAISELTRELIKSRTHQSEGSDS